MASKAPKKSSKPVSVDVASFLIANATETGPKAKKSGVPEMVGTGLAELADKASKAYREFKDAEAVFRLAEGEVLEKTGPEYETRSRKGEHTKSLNLPGLMTAGVQITYQDKFSPLAIEQEAGLKGQLGEKYDLYFEQSRKLSLKEECTDNATIQILLKVLGADEFKRMFDIKVCVVAKSDMDRKQFEIPEGVRTLVGLKQAKASLKVLKKDE